jgi:hypothetical protein
MKYNKMVLLVFALALISLDVFSSENWMIDKEDDGIKIYTRSVEGSEFRAFKGVAQYDATLDEVLKVLSNVENYPQWFGHTEASKLLAQIENENYIYVETIFPWPYSNRDLVYKVVVKKISPEKTLITIQGNPDFIPVKKNINRMTQASGKILITSLGNKTEIIYEFHCEPGNVPSWLANKLLPGYPLSTLSGLRRTIDSKLVKN